MTADRPDMLDTAAQLIAEVKENLPRSQGTTGTVIGDKQTQRIVEILEIVTHELRVLRAERDNDDGIDSGSGYYHVVDPGEDD